MKIYKIKNEYQGLTITKNIFPIGNITLDTNNFKQENIENYIKLGFGDIFEEDINIFEETNLLDLIEPTEPIENNVVIKYYTNEMNSKEAKPKEAKPKEAKHIEENIKTEDTNGESIKPKRSRKSKK